MDERTHHAQTEAVDEMFLRGGDAFRDNVGRLPDVKTKPRSRLQPVLVLGAAILLGFGIYRITTAVRTPQELDTDQQTVRQPVAVATIGTGDIKVGVTGLGAVTPIATVTVRTQVNGQLMEVGFKEGQIVKKGDFLAQIDPRPFQLSQAQYEGQLVHDQGLLDQARLDLTRYQTLVKQNSIARQQAEDQVYIVKQYEGSVKPDQAQIDTQKLNLTYARIVSPIDGRVGLRLVDAGNYVQTTDARPRGHHPIASDLGDLHGAGRRYSRNHGRGPCRKGARSHGLRPRQCHTAFGRKNRSARQSDRPDDRHAEVTRQLR